MSDPTHLPNKDIIVDTISDGPPGMLHAWTSDLQVAHVGHGDVTRDRRKMAFVTGEADETLSVYHVPSFPDRFGDDGEPPAGTDPHICYRYSGPDGGKLPRRRSRPTAGGSPGRGATASRSSTSRTSAAAARPRARRRARPR